MLTSQYENIEYVKVVEYNGEYVVGLMTKPMFTLSEKNSFVRDVKDKIVDKFDISIDNVKLTFDIDIIYLINTASTNEDIKYIADKVK